MTRLNNFERLVIHHPLRRWMQRRWEVRPLKHMGGGLQGERVLEIGCGRGDGTRLLLGDFGAKEVHGFDLDRRQIERARRRVSDLGARVKLAQADVTALPVGDASYDAVVSFNMLHHVPDWRAAVAESARVLRPGGRLLLIETLRAFLHFPLVRVLMDHPRHDRFDAAELLQELADQGFTLAGQRRLGRSFLWSVARLGPTPCPQSAS